MNLLPITSTSELPHPRGGCFAVWNGNEITAAREFRDKYGREPAQAYVRTDSKGVTTYYFVTEEE